MTVRASTPADARASAGGHRREQRSADLGVSGVDKIADPAAGSGAGDGDRLLRPLPPPPAAAGHRPSVRPRPAPARSPASISAPAPTGRTRTTSRRSGGAWERPCGTAPPRRGLQDSIGAGASSAAASRGGRRRGRPDTERPPETTGGERDRRSDRGCACSTSDRFRKGFRGARARRQRTHGEGFGCPAVEGRGGVEYHAVHHAPTRAADDHLQPSLRTIQPVLQDRGQRGVRGQQIRQLVQHERPTPAGQVGLRGEPGQQRAPVRIMRDSIMFACIKSRWRNSGRTVAWTPQHADGPIEVQPLPAPCRHRRLRSDLDARRRQPRTRRRQRRPGPA